MPNGVDEGVISYAIYEDEKMFYGVAEVDLPNFENMVFNVSGAGCSVRLRYLLLLSSRL